MEVDEGAHRAGVLVAFTGRLGGVGEPPYDSLNLALKGFVEFVEEDD